MGDIFGPEDEGGALFTSAPQLTAFERLEAAIGLLKDWQGNDDITAPIERVCEVVEAFDAWKVARCKCGRTIRGNAYGVHKRACSDVARMGEGERGGHPAQGGPVDNATGESALGSALSREEALRRLDALSPTAVRYLDTARDWLAAYEKSQSRDAERDEMAKILRAHVAHLDASRAVEVDAEHEGWLASQGGA